MRELDQNEIDEVTGAGIAEAVSGAVREGTKAHNEGKDALGIAKAAIKGFGAGLLQ